MSNEMSIFENQSSPVVSRSDRITALGKSIASSSTVTNRRIQTNTNGTFKKIVNGEQVGDPIRGEFNCIIVGMLPSVSRIYYKEKYDPNKDATLPNCWSNLGDKPEAQASDKQHANCKECPMNVAGSGDNGARACRFQRRISVMLENDKQGNVYQFNVPAKSLFGKGVGNTHPFESYVRFLVSNGESPDTVLTNVRYDENAASMELVFTPVRQLSDEELEVVGSAQSRPETQMYTKITVAQADGVTKLPSAPAIKRSDEPTKDDEEDNVSDSLYEYSQSKGKSNQHGAEKKAEAPAEDPIAEPTTRTKKKEEPVSDLVDDLSSVVSDWASEDD
jgi:hypothetical protein